MRSSLYTLLRSLFACLCLAFLTGDATAGPVREWVRDHRPGLIVPKRTASCGSCQSAPATQPPAPVYPSDPEPYRVVVARPLYTYPVGPSYVLPASGNCPTGRCPLK